MLISLLRSPQYAPLISSIIYPNWNSQKAKTLTLSFKNGERLEITLVDFQQGEFQTLLYDCANKRNSSTCRCATCDFKPIKLLITLNRISQFLADPVAKTPIFPPKETLNIPFSYPPPFEMSSEQTNEFDNFESTILIYPLRTYVLDEILKRRVDKNSIKPAKLIFCCKKL
jgi:hypothetical protein